MIRALRAALMLIAFVATATYAQAPLPEISAHSKTAFGVYKGDLLTVEVRLKGESSKAQVKWVRGGETFCRKLTCEIDTGEWSLGTHRVSFVVFDDRGSRYIRFAIRILATPPGYAPGKVRPELVEVGDDLESLDEDDHSVRSIAGRGFSYHQRKLHVVGPTPRLLDWEERLRTQADAVLRISRAKVEEHLIPPRSSVELVRVNSGRRALRLLKGSLRSRQLDNGKPRWSILVDEWLQVDTDEKGDVLVTREEEEDVVHVTALRGNVKVFQRNVDEAGIEGKATTVPQGTQVSFAPSDREPKALTVPLAKKLAGLIRATSPSYMPGQKPESTSDGSTLLAGRLPKTFDAALVMAREAVAQGDHLVALEALLAFPKESTANYEARLLLGKAYAGIFLYKEAFGQLKKARELAPDKPEPYFETGLLYLAEGSWKKAISYFEDAEDRDFEPEGLLDYYLGVANYRLGNSVSAKSHFTYSLWDPYKPEVEASAKAFLGRSTESSWLDLRFGLAGNYDTNVLRVKDEDHLPEGVEALRSPGYLASAGFTIWPYRSQDAYVSFRYDIEKREYSEPSLVKLAPMRQEMGLGFGIDFGGDGDKPKWFGFGAEALAGTLHVGTERALDQVGGAGYLRSPRLYHLALRVKSVLSLDPLPARDDGFDPYLEEIVPMSERSHRRVVYGLGLRPVEGDAIELDLGLELGKTAMRSSFQKGYDHEDQRVLVDLRWLMSLRSTLGLNVAYLVRAFPESEDSRKDTRSSADLSWRWYFTTALSQKLGVLYENQSSNREANAYSRQEILYRLDLEF